MDVIHKFPSSATFPASAVSRPAMILRMVLLPPPDGPSRAVAPPKGLRAHIVDGHE